MTKAAQADLFGGIHAMVRQHGAKGAVAVAREAANEAAAGQVVAPHVRILAGRNGRKLADSAATSIIRDHEHDHEVGYSYSAWCLTGLPHRDHPPGQDWVIIYLTQ